MKYYRIIISTILTLSISLGFFQTGLAYNSGDFVVKITTTQANQTIDIGHQAGMIFAINRGDDSNSGLSYQHTYRDPGTYTLSISGEWLHLHLGSWSKVSDVVQRGTIKRSNMENMFAYNSLITGFSASDNPDLTQVKSMKSMFQSANQFNGDISNWNTKSVTNMESLFESANSFNQPLNKWNVSNVKTMKNMFRAASKFNQDLSNRNVANVTTMENMFFGVSFFNRAINNRNVSNVTNMENMFRLAYNFNQSIGSWDVSKVSNMNNMFNSAVSFDQDLSNWCPRALLEKPSNFNINTLTSFRLDNQKQPNWDCIGSWTGSNNVQISWSNFIIKITTLSDNEYISLWLQEWILISIDRWDWTITSDNRDFHTYKKAWTYIVSILWNSLSVYLWEHSKVYDVLQRGKTRWSSMESMFQWNRFIKNFSARDTPNLHNVTSMKNMFNWASHFNGDISSWDVSNITDMSYMFAHASDFNQPLNKRKTSKLVNIESLFMDATNFNQPLDQRDVSKVNNMNSLFDRAISFNSNSLSGRDVRNVKHMEHTFEQAVSFDHDLSSRCVIRIASKPYMFDTWAGFEDKLNRQPQRGWCLTNTTQTNKRVCDTGKSNFNSEMNEAYKFACNLDITTIQSITEARVYESVTRAAFAKMISNYAKNILKLTPDTSKTCTFSDSDTVNKELWFYMTTVCQYGIMGINMKDNKFLPNDSITRGQIATILSRLHNRAKDGNPYYINHIAALEKLEIINKTDHLMEEKRWYIFIMLQRIVQQILPQFINDK